MVSPEYQRKSEIMLRRLKVLNLKRIKFGQRGKFLNDPAGINKLKKGTGHYGEQKNN